MVLVSFPSLSSSCRFEAVVSLVHSIEVMLDMYQCTSKFFALDRNGYLGAAHMLWKALDKVVSCCCTFKNSDTGNILDCTFYSHRTDAKTKCSVPTNQQIKAQLPLYCERKNKKEAKI